MDAAGGQEVRLPVLQPLELWEESGRRQAFGENLFTLQDRRRRPMVMAPTHEEVISLIARTHVQSYRDLPRIPYQIQTKVPGRTALPRRPHPRPRVRHEGRLQHGRRRRGPRRQLRGNGPGLPQHLPSLRTPCRYGGRRQRRHRRARLPRVHPTRLHRRRHHPPVRAAAVTPPTWKRPRVSSRPSP